MIRPDADDIGRVLERGDFGTAAMIEACDPQVELFLLEAEGKIFDGIAHVAEDLQATRRWSTAAFSRRRILDGGCPLLTLASAPESARSGSTGGRVPDGDLARCGGSLERMGFSICRAPIPGPSFDELPYRRLLDAATEVLIALLDLEGRIAYINGASRWLLGYAPEEMLARHFREFIPSEELAKATERFERAKGGRPHFRYVASVRRKDGGLAHLRFDATPLLGSAGAVEGIVVVGHQLDDETVSEAL